MEMSYEGKDKAQKSDGRSSTSSDFEGDKSSHDSNDELAPKTAQERIEKQAKNLLKLNDKEIIQQMRKEIEELHDENKMLKRKVDRLYISTNQANTERQTAIDALNEARMQYTKELLRKDDQIQ